MWECNTW